MEREKMINIISGDIVEIQKVLLNGGWHSEVEEYLLSNGYEKKITEIYGNKEVEYIKGNISVVSGNDLEVNFYNGFNRLAKVEQLTVGGKNMVTVSFE